jgi:hypothetical protein
VGRWSRWLTEIWEADVCERELVLAAFFETLDNWDQAKDAELFLAVMSQRQRPSPLGRVAVGRVLCLGALGGGGAVDQPTGLPSFTCFL